jgi:ADP-ribosylglycohydrolase
MLGAAIGDALGMPNDSTSPNLQKMRYGYRRAYKGHPNAVLQPGQYTDDMQILIMVATLVADGGSTRNGMPLRLKSSTPAAGSGSRTARFLLPANT